MSGTNLATRYRPSSWEEVIEQNEIKRILQNQLSNNDIKNSYLFVGSAGTGKTTCARLLAKYINNNKGTAIEIDGASNNGVDQVREISNQARTRAVDSEYKIFIIDECHMITTAGWNAMLKLLEEPPANTIFIFCTTNAEKIPETVMSRIQRYDFKRITTQGIFKRLIDVCINESIFVEENALMHIAKLADGHMRDALTMLDKVIAYDEEVTEQNVTAALGMNSYNDLAMIFNSVMDGFEDGVLKVIDGCHEEGRDLKQLIDDEIGFVFDYLKWTIQHSIENCACPAFIEEWFKNYNVSKTDVIHFLDTLINLKNTIKYDSAPKIMIEATLLLECNKGE